MLLIVFAMLLGCASANPITPLILGGSVAQLGEFPFVVSLQDKGVHFCGGSIIHQDWILTAAYCVLNKQIDDVTILAGTIFLGGQGAVYKAKSIKIHYDFRINPLENDIAVIGVSKPIQFNNNVMPTRAAWGSIVPPVLYLSGWGYTKYPSTSMSQALQYSKFKSISTNECSKLMPGIKVNNNQFCTAGLEGHGGCTGDAGGPLTDEYNQQFGVLSFGIPCGKKFPDVYTKVGHYRRWIHEVTGI